MLLPCTASGTSKLNQSWRTSGTELGCSIRGSCVSESQRVGISRSGDDFVEFGAQSHTMKFKDELSKESIVREDMGDCSETIALRRIVRWVVGTTSDCDRIAMEAMHVMSSSCFSSSVRTARVDQ